jgi:hypothetical protein
MSRASLPAEQESELDQYLTQDDEGWAHGFLTEQAQRAPWWTISFLVHCLVLVVMWRLPARVQATVRVHDGPTIIEFPPDLELPPEQPTLEFLDFEVDRNIEPVVEIDIKQPPGEDGRLGDPSEPELTPWVQEPVNEPDRTIEEPSIPRVFAIDASVNRPRRDGYKHRLTGWGEPGMTGTGLPPGLLPDIEEGLHWLATAQERDGRWSCRNWGGDGDYDVGMTGLALLAFLGRGETNLRGRHKSTISRGLAWLARNQKPNGSFGWTTFYEQGIATMAVAEAYGMTRVPRLGRVAQAAVNYIVAEQPEHGGFRYKGATTKNDGDTSVTAWQIMAIKSAVLADLNVPDSAVERCRTFLRNVRRDYGQTSYLVGQGRTGATLSAIGMACKQFIGGEEFHGEIQDCGQYLLQNCQVGQGRDHLIGDLYFTYYSTLAMFQMGGEYWYRWQRAFYEPLRAARVKEERFDGRGRRLQGSWDPTKCAWGSRGGRVYATAMAVLSLEVPKRYIRIYRPNI